MGHLVGWYFRVLIVLLQETHVLVIGETMSRPSYDYLKFVSVLCTQFNMLCYYQRHVQVKETFTQTDLANLQSCVVFCYLNLFTTLTVLIINATWFEAITELIKSVTVMLT